MHHVFRLNVPIWPVPVTNTGRVSCIIFLLLHTLTTNTDQIGVINLGLLGFSLG